MSRTFRVARIVNYISDAVTGAFNYGSVSITETAVSATEGNFNSVSATAGVTSASVTTEVITASTSFTAPMAVIDTLTVDSLVSTDSISAVTSMGAGNIDITGNTIFSINTNGNVVLSANGSGVVSVNRVGDAVAASLDIDADSGQGASMSIRKAGTRRYAMGANASDGFDISSYSDSGSFLGNLYAYNYLGDLDFRGTNPAGDGLDLFMRFDQAPNRIIVSKDAVLQGSTTSVGDIRIDKPAATSGQLLLDSDDGQWNSVRFRNGTTARFNVAQDNSNNFVIQFFNSSGTGLGNLYEYDEFEDTVFRGTDAAGTGLDEFMRFDQSSQEIVFAKPTNATSVGNNLVPVFTGSFDSAGAVSASSGISVTGAVSGSPSGSTLTVTFGTPLADINYIVQATAISGAVGTVTARVLGVSLLNTSFSINFRDDDGSPVAPAGCYITVWDLN